MPLAEQCWPPSSHRHTLVNQLELHSQKSRLIDPPGSIRNAQLTAKPLIQTGAYRWTHRQIVIWQMDKPRSDIISSGHEYRKC
jgi:hypothetical protein